MYGDLLDDAVRVTGVLVATATGLPGEAIHFLVNM